jgi:hypothetical protein
MGGRVLQGVRISWACAPHKRVSHGHVSFAGMHLKGLHLPRTASGHQPLKFRDYISPRIGRLPGQQPSKV